MDKIERFKIEKCKIEKENKEKRTKELEELRMRCDICYLSHFNEVFILKPERFSLKANRGERKARRVCWGCASWLFKTKKYNFGKSWRELFFVQRRINFKNREKYMVIHV